MITSVQGLVMSVSSPGGQAVRLIGSSRNKIRSHLTAEQYTSFKPAIYHACVSLHHLCDNLTMLQFYPGDLPLRFQRAVKESCLSAQPLLADCGAFGSIASARQF